MADRGINQDQVKIGPKEEEIDPTYRDASYLGTDEDDSEEVRDLGFIVDDHDDRRIMLTGGWQRLDDLDTDEPLERNRKGPIPHEVALRERGASPEWFATDYHVENAEAEKQEADFVETSMLRTDPDREDGVDDFTDESLPGVHGQITATNITGEVAGIGAGMGSSLTQDIGSGGFQIRDNPLITEDPLTEDQIDALRDVDEMGDDEELTALADRGARDMEGRGDIG